MRCAKRYFLFSPWPRRPPHVLRAKRLALRKTALAPLHAIALPSIAFAVARNHLSQRALTEEFCPMRLGPEGQGFCEGRMCEKKDGELRRVLPLEIRDFCSSTTVVFVHSVPGWP